jgi:predicted dehydrogenase
MDCAILGFGDVGKIYYKHILDNPKLNLKYIYDTRVEEVLHEAEILYQTGAEVLLENEENSPLKKYIVSDRLDLIITDPNLFIVFVCTPIETCYDFVKEALTYSKHVLCDKLLSRNEKQIKELYEYSYEERLVLLSGFNKRYEPQINNLKEELEFNKIGEINKVTTHIHNLNPIPSLDVISNENIKDFDFLFNKFYYEIDYINWLMDDKPISVMISNETNLKLVMEYKNDSIATINLDNEYKLEIEGVYGNLKVDKPLDIIISYKKQMEHFLDVIDGLDDILVWTVDCTYPLRIIQTCLKSIERGRRIYINYF